MKTYAYSLKLREEMLQELGRKQLELKARMLEKKIQLLEEKRARLQPHRTHDVEIEGQLEELRQALHASRNGESLGLARLAAAQASAEPCEESAAG